MKTLEITPRSPARALLGAQPSLRPTELEERALHELNAGRREAGLAPAGLDPALSDVAQAYAQLLGQQGAEVAASAVEPLLDWAGAVEVYPSFHARETPSGGDGGFLLHLREQGRAGDTGREADAQPGYTVLGIGRWQGEGSWLHVAVTARRLVELDPTPRRLPDAPPVVLQGRIVPGVDDPRAFVLGDAGRVEEAPLELSPDRRFVVRTEARPFGGELMVEFAGIAPTGPRVLARLTLLEANAAAAPTVLRLQVPEADERDLDAAQAAQRFLALVNDARCQRGSPAFVPDRLASAVAGRHARQMASHGFTGHLSQESGSPGDRFRRAGLAVSLLGECVARDRTFSQAFLSLMRSLAHRRLLLSPRFLAAGVGAARVDAPDSRELLLVCNPFRPLVHPRPREGAAELAQELRMRRETEGLPPFAPDASLRAAATRLTEALAAGLQPSREHIEAALARGSRSWEDYSAVVQGLTDPVALAEEEAFLVPSWTHAGVGLTVVPPPSEAEPPVAIVAVVLGRQQGS